MDFWVLDGIKRFIGCLTYANTVKETGKKDNIFLKIIYNNAKSGTFVGISNHMSPKSLTNHGKWHVYGIRVEKMAFPR